MVSYSIKFSSSVDTYKLTHTQAISQQIYQFHINNLSSYDIAIEISIIILIITLLYYKKSIQSYFNKVQKYVEKKSIMLSKALPHIMFFTLCFVISIIGNTFIKPIASSSIGLVTVSLVMPLVQTISTIQLFPTEISLQNNHVHYRSLLSLWIILGLHNTIFNLLGLVPFSSTVIAWLPYLSELLFVTLLWIQISPLFVAIVLDVVSPVLELITTYIIPFVNIIKEDEKTSSNRCLSGLKALKWMKIINESQEILLKSLLQDGLVGIIALLFLFTPYPLSVVGRVCVCYVLPVIRSSNSLRNSTAITLDTKNKSATQGVEGDAQDKTVWLSPLRTPKSCAISKLTNAEKLLIEERRRWLDYWIVFGILSFLQASNILYLWSSWWIVISLLLQHAYIKGASYILNNLGILLATTAPTSSSSTTTSVTTEGSSIMNDINADNIVESKENTPTPSLRHQKIK